MSTLNIYRASAGSGKTFSIAREYLTLLFQDEGAYRNILAVTFTNKATAEMKNRILNELYILAMDQKSDHLEMLVENTKETERAIRQKAKRILSQVLHDYSRFSVSTIDSFFQRVIRSFSREIQLNATFNPELDTSRILNEAVDRLFLEIDKNQDLRSWLMRFAKERIKQGKKWNIRGEIERRGQAIFDEEYKTFHQDVMEKLRDKSFLKNYMAKLHDVQEQYIAKCADFGDRAYEMMEANAVTITDFPYGKTSFASIFTKLRNKDVEKVDVNGARLTKALNDISTWYPKSANAARKAKMEGLYNAGFNDLLVETVEYIKENAPVYFTVNEIVPHLFTLGVLTDLTKHVQDIARERNLLILADSSQILRNVIGESDSPFVFEKLGSAYNNYMLDEFQDTSKLQWENFRPLLDNTLAEGHPSMIVGDVKQSIYRWRNGDWTLLAEKVPSDLKQYNPNAVTLGTNWRSAENIIGFNNSIFEIGSELVQQDFNAEFEPELTRYPDLEPLKTTIDTAYDGQFQKFSGKSGESGSVEIDFIDEEELDEEYQEEALSRMIEKMEELQQLGYPARDMAVLVRKGSEGSAVAKALMDKQNTDPKPGVKYDVISNDSLYLQNAGSVNFLVNFLEYLVNNQSINRSFLIHEYYQYILPSLPQEIQDMVNGISDGQNFLLSFFEEEKPKTDDRHEMFAINKEEGKEELPQLFQHYFGENQELFRNKPLYELVEGIVKHFHLQSSQKDWAFTLAFLDEIMEYSRKESSDVSSFLEWWRNNGNKKTLKLDEGQDAIQIYTIHKSKGLEFKMVFMPFTTWDLYPNPTLETMLWVHPPVAPMNEIELVPIRYSSKLSKTMFAPHYFLEKIQGAIDNLNVLYVAFTRPEEMLYVWTKKPKKKSKGLSNVGDLLYQIVSIPPLFDSEDRERFFDLNENWDEETAHFSLGAVFPAVEEEEKVKKEKGFAAPDSARLQQLQVGATIGNLSIENNGVRYFEEKGNLRSKADIGNMIHELFAKINSSEDIERAIAELIFDGSIDNNEAKELELKVKKLFKDTMVQDWFDPKWQVVNERTILVKGGGSYRPDRVMIGEEKVIIVDYKTGKEHDKQYTTQVKQYMRVIKEMGYKKVEGYLWYIEENEKQRIEG